MAEVATTLAATAAPSSTTPSSSRVAGLPVCRLRVCMFYGEEAPRVFVIEHYDGAGHRLKNILDGMAVAVKNKMNFGGVVPDSQVVSHGHNFREVADAFFGPGAAKQLFLLTRDVKFDAKFDNVEELEQHRAEFPNLANVFLPAANAWTSAAGENPPSVYYTDELRARLRQQLVYRPLLFASGRPAVAVHVRRGDIPPEDPRAAPVSVYCDIVEKIRRHLPNADVHVFSSTVQEQRDRPSFWNSSSFDGFREQGMQVHLDDEDLLHPWAHFARADIFVAASSSYSYIGAILNEKCVVQPGTFDKPPENWVNMKSPGMEADLKACIVKRLSHLLDGTGAGAVAAGAP